MIEDVCEIKENTYIHTHKIKKRRKPGGQVV